jgi:hypothetical protein
MNVSNLLMGKFPYNQVRGKVEEEEEEKEEEMLPHH